jgi:hypothetical protein
VRGLSYKPQGVESTGQRGKRGRQARGCAEVLPTSCA